MYICRGVLVGSLVGLYATHTHRWPSVRSKFKLILNGVNTETPDDVAYVTSGYAPISARIVQMAMANEWKRCGFAIVIFCNRRFFF